jgi:hypothetical protein
MCARKSAVFHFIEPSLALYCMHTKSDMFYPYLAVHSPRMPLTIASPSQYFAFRSIGWSRTFPVPLTPPAFRVHQPSASFPQNQHPLPQNCPYRVFCVTANITNFALRCSLKVPSMTRIIGSRRCTINESITFRDVLDCDACDSSIIVAACSSSAALGSQWCGLVSEKVRRERTVLYCRLVSANA